jgi:GNAT superfamily N-acetyltransferase
MSAEAISIRKATFDDIPEILRQRRCMYMDLQYTDPATLDAVVREGSAFLQESIPAGNFHAWLACDGDLPIAGAAVHIAPWPPHAYDLESRRATILNVYTDPAYRRRGIARRLMQTVIAWCKDQGFARVWLHASADGRYLYETLGFEPSNEMKLILREQPH